LVLKKPQQERERKTMGASLRFAAMPMAILDEPLDHPTFSSSLSTTASARSCM
jgi:hypothetical protein